MNASYIREDLDTLSSLSAVEAQSVAAYLMGRDRLLFLEAVAYAKGITDTAARAAAMTAENLLALGEQERAECRRLGAEHGADHLWSNVTDEPADREVGFPGYAFCQICNDSVEWCPEVNGWVNA
jgi:hypothetical protein